MVNVNIAVTHVNKVIIEKGKKMEKIKPEVIGYSRVFNNGYISDVTVNKRVMKKISTSKNKPDECFHPNGKHKFRPVYKKQNSPN